jgi:hypothetical protein
MGTLHGVGLCDLSDAAMGRGCLKSRNIREEGKRWKRELRLHAHGSRGVARTTPPGRPGFDHKHDLALEPECYLLRLRSHRFCRKYC